MTTTAARGSPSGPAKIIKTTVTIDHGNVAANSVDLAPTGAVANLRTTDIVIIDPPTGGLTANLAVGSPYCSAAGVLTVPIINPTAGIIASASRTYQLTILRFDS
jgi:hypothetical protein